MSYILDKLYLGGIDDASRPQKLVDKGITHILTVNSKPLPIENRQGFTYKYVNALDMEDTDLLGRFEECIQFIEEARQEGAVLIHCYVGCSRSATIAIAYAMAKMDLGFAEAKELVARNRPMIRPNDGFEAQLKIFEAMGNRIDRENNQYKIYRLKNIASVMQRSRGQCLLEGSLSVDPLEKSTPGGTVYKCKKCRRPLFQSTCLLPHAVGIGDAAFDWRGSLSSTSADEDKDEAVCDQSLFIEPVQWMGDYVLALEGKLSCPKCHAKLGSFNWSGERCPCGTWVTPAFHVGNSKVDKTRPRVLPPQYPPAAAASAGKQQPTIPQTATMDSSTEFKLIVDSSNRGGPTELETITVQLPDEVTGLKLNEDLPPLT